MQYMNHIPYIQSLQRKLSRIAVILMICAAAAVAQGPTGSTIIPLGTYSVDEPGRVPFVSTIGPLSGGDPMLFQFGPVAAGHRVVVQNIFAHALATGSAPQVVVTINSSRGSSVLLFPVVNADDIYTGGATTFYADAGDSFQVTMFDPTFGLNFYAGLATVTGYEVDCKVAPCTPFPEQSEPASSVRQPQQGQSR